MRCKWGRTIDIMSIWVCRRWRNLYGHCNNQLSIWNQSRGHGGFVFIRLAHKRFVHNVRTSRPIIHRWHRHVPIYRTMPVVLIVWAGVAHVCILFCHPNNKNKLSPNNLTVIWGTFFCLLFWTIISQKPCLQPLCPYRIELVLWLSLVFARRITRMRDNAQYLLLSSIDYAGADSNFVFCHIRTSYPFWSAQWHNCNTHSRYLFH